MKFYIEITLLPSTEIPLYFLWEKVYQQIHLALVEVKNADGLVTIGGAFPEYSARKKHLGNKLRLFAESEDELINLNMEKWLSRLTDYVHITKTRSVPEPEGFALFKRAQPKSSVERLARRKAKREGISFGEAMRVLQSFEERSSDLPYIHIKSLSSAKRYRLMISYMETDKKPEGGLFSTYGLSSQSSVPIF